MIIDRFGRPVLNLRVSLTQRCNLKCPYCHREGERTSFTEMSTDEVLRIVRIAISLNISWVKLTGGEPLLRPDILEIIRGITEFRGLRDLSMTTNGMLLSSLAKPLREGGLKRVNVSIPTLDSKIYHDLMGGNLDYALKGIEEAVKAGLFPVKLNMLVLKGVNDKEVFSMLSFAERVGAVLQLIELEPINLSKTYHQHYHYDLIGIEKELEKRAVEIRTRWSMQRRKVYLLPNVKVEVIRPIENTNFCGSCTRLRISSDGLLKPCLMNSENLIDVLSPMRNGANDEELTSLFMEAIKRREPYYMQSCR